MRTALKSLLVMTFAWTIVAAPAAAQGLCLPWQGTPQSEINSFEDAWEHWNSDAGGSVPAGYDLYSEIVGGAQWNSYVDDLTNRLTSQLQSVSKTSTRGTISRVTGYRGWECYPLGSYRMNVEYSGSWTGSSWRNNQRIVSGRITVKFSFSDRWDFVWNDSYTYWQNVFREFFPEVIAGCGAPYTIYGSFNTTLNLQATQRR